MTLKQLRKKIKGLPQKAIVTIWGNIDDDGRGNIMIEYTKNGKDKTKEITPDERKEV